MIDPLYPSPAETRRKKRQRAPGAGGTSFYIQRGREFVSPTEYRDRRRDPEARLAVKLARELTKLSEDFPRFRLALNRLNHHVLLQVRSQGFKNRVVLKCLHQQQASSVRDVCRDSGLDFVSVTTTIEHLRSSDQIVACNRAGRPLLVVAQTNKTYWLRK